MSNGVIVSPIDSGNHNIAFGLIGPVLLSIIGPGPCANMDRFFPISSNYDRSPVVTPPPPAALSIPAATGHFEIGMRFHRRIEGLLAVRDHGAPRPPVRTTTQKRERKPANANFLFHSFAGPVLHHDICEPN